jgi:hypothetical protein
LDRGLGEEAEQHELRYRLPSWPTCLLVGPEARNFSLTWCFPGPLYVDMLPEQVPVPWGSFSSAEGESAWRRSAQQLLCLV